MMTPWQQHPAHPWSTGQGWPLPLYYSPGYWHYVANPYPIYPPVAPAGQELMSRDQQGPSAPEIQLHRFLGGQRRPTAVWDIAQNIGTARRVTSRRSIEPLTPHFFSLPATNPPVSQMRIVSESFPWDILIDLPPRAPDKFISIKIVLDSIHAVLQEPLDTEEWREKCSADRKKIHKDMCMRLANGSPSMKAGGSALRIDCLLDRTMFMGLRPGGPYQDEWILSLGPRRTER